MMDVTSHPRVAAPIDPAMETLVREESRRLFSIAYSILRDFGEAEDAVQATLVKAWRDWNWKSGGSPPPAWLTRVCVNECLNRRRSALRRLQVGLRAVDRQARQDIPPSTSLDLARAYSKLTKRQRASVALHYYHGYTLDECAALLGRSPGTVRSHLARALERLRHEVSGDG